jgi:thioredoxin-related protein
VLSDTSIVNFIDSNFTAYKLDMEYDSPNATKFMIDGVPAIILFDQKGAEMAVLQGYHDAKEFRKFLKQRLR